MQGIKVNQVEFNIGLNDNPYKDEFDLRQILKQSKFNIFDTTPSRIELGEYLESDEPTFIINTSTTMTNDEIISEVEGLCKMFSQECIAIKINLKGHLVYHPSYEGMKLDFMDKYFIDAYYKKYLKNYK